MRYIILFIFLIRIFLYSEGSELIMKMNTYETNTKLKWSYNPFKYYETDRYFSSWTDPNAYNSSILLNTIFNIKEMYQNPNFRFDDTSVFYQPTLAAELVPISFKYTDNHRFKIGVGYLTHFFLSAYKNDVSQYYGKSLMYGTYMQVDTFFDYIYNDILRFRFVPIRHICSHVSGDILGDETLYDKDREEFIDNSFEQMQLSLHFKYSWFTFYGGTYFALTGFDNSNFVTLFGIFSGIDFRVPLWGEINFITSLYLAANLDKINTIKRGYNEYHLLDSYDKWTPSVALGIGFEIYKVVIGLKYEYARSKQLYAYRSMENKIGVEASVYLGN